MLGDLLFYAFTHTLSENWLSGLDDQAFHEAHYGGSGVSHLARVQRDDVERKFHFRAESWNLFDGSMTGRRPKNAYLIA